MGFLQTVTMSVLARDLEPRWRAGRVTLLFLTSTWDVSGICPLRAAVRIGLNTSYKVLFLRALVLHNHSSLFWLFCSY